MPPSPSGLPWQPVSHSDLTRSAIMAVDFVLVPVQPSPLDVWAVHEVVELVQQATIYKPAHQVLARSFRNHCDFTRMSEIVELAGNCSYNDSASLVFTFLNIFFNFIVS